MNLLEITQLSISSRRDKYCLAYSQSEILHNMEINELQLHATTWMDLARTILSKRKVHKKTSIIHDSQLKAKGSALV